MPLLRIRSALERRRQIERLLVRPDGGLPKDRPRNYGGNSRLERQPDRGSQGVASKVCMSAQYVKTKFVPNPEYYSYQQRCQRCGRVQTYTCGEYDIKQSGGKNHTNWQSFYNVTTTHMKEQTNHCEWCECVTVHKLIALENRPNES